MTEAVRGGPAGWLGAAVFLAVAAALMLPAAPASAQTVNCYDVWPGNTGSWGTWVEADGSTATYMPCELYEPESSNISAEFGVDVKIWLPGETRSSTAPGGRIPGWRERPNPDATPNAGALFAEAIRKTLGGLQPALAPLNIHMILLQNVSGQGEGTDDWDWNTQADTLSGDPCPITIFMTDLIYVGAAGNSPADPQDVKATIAHEIYHCYQKKYFRRQERADPDVDGWWVEGTAEFVGTQLFPCSPTSAGFASDYRMSTRLNRQINGGYTNFIFYTHLADRHGFDFAALADFSRGMATTSGMDAQDRALAAYADIGAKYHSFAQAYIDGMISHCVAGNVAFDDVAQYAATDGLEVPLDAKPFTFGASIVTVPKRKTFQVRLEDGSGDGGNRKTSFRRQGEYGAWTEVSGEFTLEGDCESDTSYTFTSTVEGMGETVHNASLVFSGEDIDQDLTPTAVLCGPGMDPSNRNECRHCEAVRKAHNSEDDKCLLGTWQLEYGYWEHEADVKRELTRGAAVISVESVGDRVLRINPDGTFRTVAGSMSTTLARGDGHMTVSADIQPGVGNWSAKNGKLRSCSISDKESVVMTIVGPDFNMTTPPKKTSQPVHFGGAMLTYTCTPGELTIQAPGVNPTGNTPLQWVYKRLSAATDRCDK